MSRQRNLSLNRSMDGFLNDMDLFGRWGVFVTNFGDDVGVDQLVDVVRKENPTYSVGRVDIADRGSVDPVDHGRLLLAHNDSGGNVTLLNAEDSSYTNNGESTENLSTTPNDSFYIVLDGRISVNNGNLRGLLIGCMREDLDAADYTHHLPSGILAVDPVQPDFGCGDKLNHYSKWSVYQRGTGNIPLGDSRLQDLPEGKLRPNLSNLYGAHFVSPAKSRVHSHEIGEIYFGGDGVLFVYNHELSDVVALELGPDTVVYISKELDDWPPIHGAVARDQDDPKGCWVTVFGEWNPETFYDTLDQIKLTEQFGGHMIAHPGKVIEDRLPRPMNSLGQEFATQKFQYQQR